MTTKKIKITVEVEDVTEKMFLRSEIATGQTDDGRELEVCSVVPDGSLHYKVGNKAYLVGMKNILKALLQEIGTS